MKRKYGNKPVEMDGIKFASIREHREYCTLKLRQRSGHISRLECHPTFKLIVDGVLIGKFTPDFKFIENGKPRIIEVKSPATAKETAFRLRKKLFEALYKIPVEVVT